MKFGSKMLKTVKGKLGIGAKIVHRGGVHNVLGQLFSVKAEDKLLKFSKCHLSTTAGPIAGILFISTEKVAFCSERSLAFNSPSGELVRTPYKAIIPLTKIMSTTQSENVNKPTQKYLEIVTVDNFGSGFWAL